MNSLYKDRLKRAFDLAVAIALAPLLLPLLALVALLIKLDSAGPALFIQPRLGRGGKIFRVYKFRTMIDRPRKPDREIYRNDPEVTRLGHFLRRFKVDELPQVFNVLKGEMSLVGPRPGLPSQRNELDEEAKARLTVRPGLTGLAQTAGSIYLSWPERWKLDVYYVRHLSFWFDLRILFKTVAVVVFGEQRFKKPWP